MLVQWVKDPPLSLQWLKLLLWHRFGPWLQNLYMLWAWPERETEGEGEGEEEGDWITPPFNPQLHSQHLKKLNKNETLVSESFLTHGREKYTLKKLGEVVGKKNENRKTIFSSTYICIYTIYFLVPFVTENF